MGDYLGTWPHTPLSEHGSFPLDPMLADFPGMDGTADHLLQSVTEPGLVDHTSAATAETIHPAATSRYPQYLDKACSSSGSSSGRSNSGSAASTTSTSDGSLDMFGYQSMALGHGMDTGDSSMAAASPYTCSSAQSMRPVSTPRSHPRSGNSNRSRASPMDSGACTPYYHEEACQPSHHNHHTSSAAGSCCCPHTAGGSKEHGRQRSIIRPLDMESLYMQGLVVEPSDCGDGVTIRLQPTPGAEGGRANLVAFMIQRDDQAYRMDHDGHQ